MSIFRVGMKVCCVNDTWQEVLFFGQIFPPRVPMLNEVLTITSVNPPRDNKTCVFLSFEEIEFHQMSGDVGADVTYASTHFRPVVERKTSIEVFQALLTPSKTPVSA